MKRVLIITATDLRNSSPQILYLAESLREEGCDVSIIGPIHKDAFVPGVNLFRVPPGRLCHILTVLGATVKACLLKYDLLIGFDEVGRIPCLLAGRIHPELKVILYNLEYFEDQAPSRCQKTARILSRCIPVKQALIVDANEDRALLRAKLPGSNRVEVVHNAAPLNAGKRPPEDAIYDGIPKDRVRLVYSGCKNHTVAAVIRALNRVRCPVHFFVVGEISQDYRDALQESGCGDRVTLTGLVPRHRLPSILAWADIGVSLYGNDPGTFIAQRMCASNKIYEYMSWGLPSICSDNPPLVRLVQDNGWGLCIPPGDEGEIAEAIRKLAEDTRLRAEMSGKAVALHRDSMNYREQIKPIFKFMRTA